VTRNVDFSSSSNGADRTPGIDSAFWWMGMGPLINAAFSLAVMFPVSCSIAGDHPENHHRYSSLIETNPSGLHRVCAFWRAGARSSQEGETMHLQEPR
jgi:hypothetical protein